MRPDRVRFGLVRVHSVLLIGRAAKRRVVIGRVADRRQAVERALIVLVQRIVQREPVVSVIAVSLRSALLFLFLFLVVVTVVGVVMTTSVVLGLVAPDFRYRNKVEDDDHKKAGRADRDHGHREIVLELGICGDSARRKGFSLESLSKTSVAVNENRLAD